MTFHQPSAPSTAAFLLLVGFIILAIPAGVYRASRRLGRSPLRSTLLTVLALVLWLALTSAVVVSGALPASPMPGIPLFFAAVLGAGVIFAFSPAGKLLAQGLSLPVLVAFQAFRLPLELILHSWARQGTIPETMTWTGLNYDVFSGLIALLAAPVASRYRAAAWLANLLGLVLLLNVARVAAFSSPLPFAWPVQPPLQLAFHLPYAWIGPVCVSAALAGHLILTRALLRREFPASVPPASSSPPQ